MAQTRPSQRPTPRAGLNREQQRRGLGVAAPSGASRGPAVSVAGARRGRGPIAFFRETRSELRKVVWPTPRETWNLTVVVLALSLAVGLFLGAFDFIFQEFFRWLISSTGGGV